MPRDDTRFRELRALAEKLEGMPPGLDPELFKQLMEDLRRGPRSARRAAARESQNARKTAVPES